MTDNEPMAMDEDAELEVPESLGKEVTRGMLWTSLSSLMARALGFATTIIIVNWLDQDDYGRANAAVTIAGTIGFLLIPGLESELIRRKRRFGEAATQAFMLCNLLMLLLCSVSFVHADWIAALFNAPGAGFYLRVALAVPVMDTLFVLGNVLLCRHLRFGLQSVLEFGGSCTNVGTAVGLAASGFGGLAVVLGHVLREGLIRVGSTVATGLRWLRRPRKDTELLREMLAFGIPVYISELFEFAATNWDNLFVSRVFGPSALGAYAVAYTISYTPIYTVATRTSAVVLAAVARFADDVERRHEAVLRSLGAVMMLLSPAAVLIMLEGPRVVQLLFPDRWTAALGVLVVALAPVGIGLPMQFLVDYYFQAIGKPRATALVMGLKVALMFLALLLFGRGTVGGAAWSVSGSFVAAGLLACSLLTIVDKIPLALVFRQLVPAAVGTTVMGLTIHGIARWAPLSSNVLMMTVEIVGGGVIYVVYQLLFHRARVMDILGTLLGWNDDDDDDDLDHGERREQEDDVR